MNLIEKVQAIDPKFLQPFAEAQKEGNADSLASIFTKIINVMLFISAALAVIYFIYSGILYITSAGNPDNVKKGQTGLIYGSIGIAVIVLSYFVVRAIATYASKELGNAPAPR